MSDFIVGLTGGIGSGKTAASDHFEALGITVVDADLCARIVVEPGKPALQQIAEHFGSEILLPDGNLDRAALRQKVFADEQQRKWLEELLHPLIFQEIIDQLNSAESPYSLLVSPLLIEGGQKILCQKVIVVDVPEEIQLQRAMSRDSNSEQQIRSIMATQASRQERLKQADYVLKNTGSIEELQKQVDTVHQELLQLAKP